MAEQQPLVDYIIVSAVSDEMVPYLAACDNLQEKTSHHIHYQVGDFAGKRLALVLCGMGTTNAAAVAGVLINTLQPKAIFFSGCAGAVQKDTHIGDVVVAETAFEADIQGIFSILIGTPYEPSLMHPLKKEQMPKHFFANQELLKKAKQLNGTFNVGDLEHLDNSAARVLLGKVASSNSFPSPVGLFQGLRDEGVLAMDMESSAIYQTAWLYNVPSLVIRSISNAIHDDNTENTTQETLMIAGNNAARYLKALISIL